MNSLRRHMMMQRGGGGGLPVAYQQVEYIYSNGQQCIDSGYYPTTDNIDIEFIFQMFSCGHATPSSVMDNIIGSYNGRYTGFTCYSGRRGSFNFYFETANTYTSSTYTFTTAKTKLRCFANDRLREVYVDDALFFSGPYSGSIANSATHTFFAAHNTLGVFPCIEGNMYHILIKSEGVVRRDMYPCYRKSDDEVGMYDLATHTFFTNAGTGAFTAGPDVN